MFIMRFSALVIGFSYAASTTAAAVPSVEQRSGAIDTQATEILTQRSENFDLQNITRRGGSATGCVQARCGFTSSFDGAGDYMGLQVYHNGEYIFELVGEKASSSSETQWFWKSVTDRYGYIWSFQMVGNCKSFYYDSQLQNTYGYYEVPNTVQHPGTYQCYSSGNGLEFHCIDDEAIFADNTARCSKYPTIPTCGGSNQLCKSIDPGSPTKAQNN